MQVILREDVDHLGYRGDVVEVKRGYWRNYLQPRGFAETATTSRMAELTARMERRRAVEAANEAEAIELRDLLARTAVTIPASAGPQGKLFGSVGAGDIAKSLESARKLRLDAKRIALDEPIKALGTYMVPINVYQGITAEIAVTVVESTLAVEIPAEKIEGLDEELAASVERHPKADETADATEGEPALEADVPVAPDADTVAVEE